MEVSKLENHELLLSSECLCIFVLSCVFLSIFPRVTAVAHERETKTDSIVNMYNNLNVFVCFTKFHCGAYGCSQSFWLIVKNIHIHFTVFTSCQTLQ